MTTSGKVAVGVAGDRVGQLLAGWDDGRSERVAVGKVRITFVAGVVRPEASGRVGVLRFGMVLFLSLARVHGDDLGEPVDVRRAE